MGGQGRTSEGVHCQPQNKCSPPPCWKGSQPLSFTHLKDPEILFDCKWPEIGHWTALNKFLSDAHKGVWWTMYFYNVLQAPLLLVCIQGRIFKTTQVRKNCRWVGHSTLRFSDRWLLRQSTLDDKWLYIKAFKRFKKKKSLQETFELKFNDHTKLPANQVLQAFKEKGWTENKHSSNVREGWTDIKIIRAVSDELNIAVIPVSKKSKEEPQWVLLNPSRRKYFLCKIRWVPENPWKTNFHAQGRTN